MFACGSQREMITLEDELINIMEESLEDTYSFNQKKEAVFQVALTRQILDVDSQLDSVPSASTACPESSRPVAEGDPERKRRRLTKKSSGADVPRLSQSQPVAEPVEADPIGEMFDKLLDGAKPKELPEDAYIVQNSTGDILDDIKHMTQLVEEALPNLPEGLSSIRRLCVLAMASLSWRAIDFGLLEKVYVLQATEGDLFLRAHRPFAFAYLSVEGSWDKLGDTLPQGTLRRIKSYMLQVEGLFRASSLQERCDQTKLLEYLKTELADKSKAGIARVMGKWLVAATSGSAAPTAGPAAEAEVARASAFHEGRVGEEATAVADPLADAAASEARDRGLPFSVAHANMIQRLSARMQAAMLSDQLLKHFIQWCHVDKRPATGCAFKDGALLFNVRNDDGTFENVKEVKKGADANIYRYIDHPLFDPLEDSIKSTITDFYRTTFWQNKAALNCLFAGISEALRGNNVDRGQFGISQGGVGQSINTYLLQSFLGALHRYLDLSVYYSEDQMLRQSGTYEDIPVLTGQEKPEGTKEQLRTHLFKLHMSGDPTAQRDLYHRVTRMIELIGLKRFEFNSMIIFSGVTHENFYSLYRRALIILYQCRVYDPRYIEKHCGVNPASRGIFPRDPSLKKKLGSPGSGAVMVKLLRGVMEKNSSDNCVQLMEDYAMNGGDNGATRLELMKACNLNPEVVPHNVSSPETTPTKTLTDEFQFQQGKATPMLREANAVMSYMLDMCLDRMNANEVRKIKAIKIPGDPNAFLDKLCNAGHFAKFTNRQK